MPRTKESFESMRETTRLKIEAAALSLFARKGLSVTMNDVAKAAEISKGLIYNHYTSKEALITELVRQATTSSSYIIADIAKSAGTAAEKIRYITAMMCRMLSDSSMSIDYFMFMLQVRVSGYSIPETVWYSNDVRDPISTFAGILVQGQGEKTVVPGDPHRLSFVYWAAIQGLCSYAGAGVLPEQEPFIINRIVLREAEIR